MFNKFVSNVDLSKVSDEEKDFMAETKIEFSKLQSEILKKSRAAAKIEKCYYCNENPPPFCNSHSVPAFCLRRIAEQGKIADLNSLLELPILGENKGVNNTGTFRIICRDCDSKIFSDYESPQNYEIPPTPKMLAQIALKNNLKSISKRFLDKNVFNNIPMPEEMKNGIQSVFDFDLNENIICFKNAKRALEDDRVLKREYNMYYYEKLNYVVPLTFQACIALSCDFEGNIINDLYNESSDYAVKSINICVFPLENESVIIMFVENGCNRYKEFNKQFKKLSLDDKLLALTYIMFAYTEDVYFSPKIQNEVKKYSELVETSGQIPILSSFAPISNPNKQAADIFDLSKRSSVPNLLSEKYKIG